MFLHSYLRSTSVTTQRVTILAFYKLQDSSFQKMQFHRQRYFESCCFARKVQHSSFLLKDTKSEPKEPTFNSIITAFSEKVSAKEISE